jgi:outer membrane protein OmpA-like peptidoglycan-associated protein
MALFSGGRRTPPRDLCLAALTIALAACGRTSTQAADTRQPVQSQPAKSPSQESHKSDTQDRAAPSTKDLSSLSQLFNALTDKDTAAAADTLFKGLNDLFASAEAERKAPELPAEPLPAGLAFDERCDEATATEAEQLHAAASARIPLVEGLTLTTIWVRQGENGFEHECLTQVTKVDGGGIYTALSCNRPNGTRYSSARIICARDFVAAPFFHPGWYTPRYSPAIRGSTLFTFPTQMFKDLRGGPAAHHLLEIDTNRMPASIRSDYAGSLERGPAATEHVIVNDRAVDLPVIESEGTFKTERDKSLPTVTIRSAILDDERFPLVLEYGLPEKQYSLKYVKISYPTKTAIEDRLAQDEAVDVYGIYFDFASDRLRPESAPVLEEIAGVMTRHPDWQLSIAGHTDNIGGNAANLELSKRRAAAVRDALVTHFGIDGSRLTTSGYGAGSPKDTNDTIEGRARNRRVELRRHR